MSIPVMVSPVLYPDIRKWLVSEEKGKRCTLTQVVLYVYNSDLKLIDYILSLNMLNRISLPIGMIRK